MLSLTACGAAGTYELKSMGINGVTIDVKDIKDTLGIDPDVTLKLKQGGGFSMKSDGESVLEGTWKASGKDVALDYYSVKLYAALDGRTLTLEYDSGKLVFRKK